MQYNLFERYAGKSDDPIDSKDVANRRYILCHDIEEAYLKHAAEHGKPCGGDTSEHIRPRFYDIASADYNAQVDFFCVITSESSAIFDCSYSCYYRRLFCCYDCHRIAGYNAYV